MKSATILGEILLPLDGHKVEIRSLHQVLQEVTDSRKKRGRRYEGAVALPIIVLAKLSGESGLSGTAHWARLRMECLRRILGVPRAAPSVPIPISTSVSTSPWTS